MVGKKIFFNFFFWPCHTAYRIPVPRAGIKPVPIAIEVWILNHWTTRKVLEIFLK